MTAMLFSLRLGTGIKVRNRNRK